MNALRSQFTIFLLAIFSGIFFVNLDTVKAAETTLVSTNSGGKLYTYTTNCTSDALQNTQAIILPESATTVEELYLYFHGTGSPGATSFCSGNSSLCGSAGKLAAQGKKPAIIVNLGHKAGSESEDKVMTKEQTTCFLNEAKQKISTIVTLNSSGLTVIGHSMGSNSIMHFLQDGFTAKQTIILDGCFKDRCKKIASLDNSGPMFVYATLYLDSFNQGKTALSFYPTKISLYEMPGSKTDVSAHNTVATACFMDHVTKDLCGGKAKAIKPDSNLPATEKPVTTQATTDVPTLLTDEKVQELLQKPVPKIKIPGLSFSEISIEGLKKQDDGGDFYLNVPFIGEYTAAVYRYLVVIAGIISVAMIVIGGFQYAVPDPSGESKSAAKNRIVHATTGLIITLSSYAILYTINPELVAFKNLKIFYVRGTGEGTAEHFVETIQSQATAGFTPVPCTGKKAQPSEAIIGVGDFVRSEPYSCGDRDLSTVKWLVLHEGGRKDTIGYLTKKGLSTHFEVKRDGTIIQAVDIRRRAAHAGSVSNPWSVGIDLQISEGCADQSGKCVNNKECSAKCDYTDAQYESVNQIINVLTQKTGIKKDDDHIIAHCQIRYPSSKGHGDPRNFDWTKIGLNPDKHRQNQNYVNGRCIKTYDSNIYGPLMKGAKPVKKEAVGCCSFTVNNQPSQADMTRADCENNPESYDFSEEKCVK